MKRQINLCFLVTLFMHALLVSCTSSIVAPEAAVKILVHHIDTESLLEYDIVEFGSDLSSNRGILLLDKIDACIDVREIAVNQTTYVELKRLYTYVPPGGEVGLQLNGRFNVQVDGRDTTYTFMSENYVYICKSM